MEAEKISADTENTIAQEKLIRDAEMNKAKSESATQAAIFKAE
jgi:hypothetical protein